MAHIIQTNEDLQNYIESRLRHFQRDDVHVIAIPIAEHTEAPYGDNFLNDIAKHIGANGTGEKQSDGFFETQVFQTNKYIRNVLGEITSSVRDQAWSFDLMIPLLEMGINPTALQNAHVIPLDDAGYVDKLAEKLGIPARPEGDGWAIHMRISADYSAIVFWKERAAKTYLEELPFTDEMLQEMLSNRGRKSGSGFDRAYHLKLGEGNPASLLNNPVFLEAAKQYRPGYSMEVREKDGVFTLHY